MTTGAIAMTAPERAVYNVLIKLGVPFEFQSKMLGGRDEKGGLIADFTIPSLMLIIRVQGEYYHYGRPSVEARDLFQKEALTSLGWTVIDILGDDAVSNANYYVSEALKGISHA